MNKAAIYTFITSLLDDYVMDSTLFETFLDVAQSNRENYRPWVILRKVDETQTALTSDTFTTAKNLPSDFRKFYGRAPIVLVDSQGNAVKALREIPIGMKNRYRLDGGKFYVNYITKQLFICGTQSQNLTISQNYIYKTTKISALDANTWVFSAYDDYEKMLGFDVAVMFKLGVDYDIINNAQGNNNAAQANLIMHSMEEWDNELANSATQGMDYGSGNMQGFTDLTGNAGNLIG